MKFQRVEVFCVVLLFFFLSKRDKKILFLKEIRKKNNFTHKQFLEGGCFVDFLRITSKSVKKDLTEVYPKFIMKTSKDLMIRGGDFYAIWDERKGLWSKDQDDVIELIDAEIDSYLKGKPELEHAKVLYMWDADSGMIDKWHKYVQKQLTDNYHSFDEKIIFANNKYR